MEATLRGKEKLPLLLQGIQFKDGIMQENAV